MNDTTYIPDWHPVGDKTIKSNKNRMRKYIYLIVFLFAGIFIGNQLFNHIHAWLGITVIIATVIYFFNRLIKYLKDENIV